MFRSCRQCPSEINDKSSEQFPSEKIYRQSCRQFLCKINYNFSCQLFVISYDKKLQASDEFCLKNLSTSKPVCPT